MSADYDVRIDWDGDGGLTRLNDWGRWAGGGTVHPTVEPSTVRSYTGGDSLLVTWGTGGSLPLAGILHDGLTAGVTYTLRGWVWVPSGSVRVLWAVAGVGVGLSSTVFGDWQEITLTFTATSAIHHLQIWPLTSPAGGEQVWLDEPTIQIDGEDVTARILNQPGISIQYGRDQARSLSPIAPGEASFELDNRSRDYSPENPSSPLAGNILPARPVRIQATLGSTVHTLYQGSLDDFDVRPGIENRSVQVSCLDTLARFRGVTISTELHHSITTGQAVQQILDAIGWPANKRDIDKGATTIRWWWEEGADALDALNRVVYSEGPTSFVYVDSDENVVFRGRHHRLQRNASLTSQATFRDSGDEPLLSAPLVYDHGWRDIVNSVVFAVEERDPSSALSVVWDSDSTITLADGETRLVDVRASEPFIGARVEAGTDITVASGTVFVFLTRTSGQSAVVKLRASGGPAVVTLLQVRAYTVPVKRTRRISAEDSASIGKYGVRSYPQDAPWAGRHDAAAIASMILAHRAERLPIVEMTIRGGNDTRLAQQLSRDLSDRVTIVEAETGLNDAFYVERIRHEISAGLHVTAFGCEMAPTPPTGPFTFDVAGHGFDDGTFAAQGLDDSTAVFIFDHATQGQFDVGVFAT